MFFKLFKRYPFLGVSLQELDEHVTKIVADFSNDCIQYFFNVCWFYVLLHLVVCLIFNTFKQILLKFELVHQNSNCPDVSLFTIVALQSLRGSILKSTYESGKWILILQQHSRKTIVAQFDVPLIGDKDILWFQLPIDDSLIVQSLDASNDLSN